LKIGVSVRRAAWCWAQWALKDPICPGASAGSYRRVPVKS